MTETAYRFSLYTMDTDILFMSTSVDAPDPSIDLEFWEKFLEGGFYMVYLGEVQETNDG
jgi:hypothetical protein